MSSYRCFLHRDPQIAETGVRDADTAARLALAVSGADAVVEVVRLEDAS